MKTAITTLFTVFMVFLMGMGLQAQTPETHQEVYEREPTWWEILFGIRPAQPAMNEAEFYDELYRKIDLAGEWAFSIGDNAVWLSADYPDDNWEKISVPSDWESQGFNGYDGYAVYRIHFDGRELREGDTHFLLLGYVDDVDETFLNGTMIGRSGTFPPRYRTAYNTNRKYHLPTEAINFDGDNVIAIRVYDDRLIGGIHQGKPGIYVTSAAEDLLQDLYGEWQFKKGSNSKYRDPEYDDSDWEKIIVPSFWDNQGYRSYDGSAWYRKSFNLEFTPDDNKKYYLLLGKIDDYDVAYFNGTEIGRTDDGKPFGSSESYRKLRIYEIPFDLLLSGRNVIAVKVTDEGLEGGIYKGPIGIVEEGDLTRIYRNTY
jgi:sialate O-acetylesterase